MLSGSGTAAAADTARRCVPPLRAGTPPCKPNCSYAVGAGFLYILLEYFARCTEPVAFFATGGWMHGWPALQQVGLYLWPSLWQLGWWMGGFLCDRLVCVCAWPPLRQLGVLERCARGPVASTGNHTAGRAVFQHQASCGSMAATLETRQPLFPLQACGWCAPGPLPAATSRQPCSCWSSLCW